MEKTKYINVILDYTFQSPGVMLRMYHDIHTMCVYVYIFVNMYIFIYVFVNSSRDHKIVVEGYIKM